MPSIDTGWVGASWENQTDLPDEMLLSTVRETAQYLQQWTRETRAQKGRSNLFDRSKFAVSENPYEQMKVARLAVRDDDVVGAAADVTESLILQGTQWGGADADAADIFNQISADINLDGYLRTAYREGFSDSQSVTAVWWGSREYTSRVRRPSGKKNADGTDRTYPARRAIRLYVPTKIITLDSTCVVPIGMSVFGEDRLAWHATPSMLTTWSQMDAGMTTDLLMANLFQGTYTPGRDEEQQLIKWGVDPKRLIEFRPDTVWRHTRTRSSFQPFPDIRMASVFRLLDLKQQLLESDRVMLVGAANYILLVKKGTDGAPASQPEVDNLKEGFTVIAKLPVIVSDHRLSIEIISPALDMTLVADKYNVLDARILARLFGAPAINSGARGDQNSGITTRMMARTLENQRHMLRRMVEKRVRDAIWDNPRNVDAVKRNFKEKPSLFFTPRNVQLDNDAQIITAIMAARAARDLSRESELEFLGFDQAVEAQRMQREAEVYDDIFKTAVPFTGGGGDGGGGTPSAIDGAKGGRPVGGGESPQSMQGKVKKRTSTGAPSTGGAGS